MDEYDVLIRTQVSQSVFSHYLLFLNDLFKSIEMRQVVELAYITGILPIVKERMQSKLNNFTEYSMLKPGDMAEYIGFTRNEVEKEWKLSVDRSNKYMFIGKMIEESRDLLNATKQAVRDTNPQNLTHVKSENKNK